MMHNKSRSPRSDSFFFLIFTITIFGRHHKTLFTHQWLKCIFQITYMHTKVGFLFLKKFLMKFLYKRSSIKPYYIAINRGREEEEKTSRHMEISFWIPNALSACCVVHERGNRLTSHQHLSSYRVTYNSRPAVRPPWVPFDPRILSHLTHLFLFILL